MAEVRRWYDAFDLPSFMPSANEPAHVGIYAPYSVMLAYENGVCGTYWPTTETYEELRHYIDMDFCGLQANIVRAIGGEELRVNPETFQNDMVSIGGKDDVLTLLVHLGYLCYDMATGYARVPNEEVRSELFNAVSRSRHEGIARIMRDSMQLVKDVLAMDEEAVASAISRAHDASCSHVNYNDEEALRAVVKAVLIASVDEWAQVDELPSARGFCDIAYLPRRGSGAPALVVELKWDKPVSAAIDQMLQRNYPQVMQDLGVPILLVCVTYDVRTKEHVARIVELPAS